jgi:hypothetical protein
MSANAKAEGSTAIERAVADDVDECGRARPGDGAKATVAQGDATRARARADSFIVVCI